MSHRRSLSQGLQATPAPLKPGEEKEFVYGNTQEPPLPAASPPTSAPLSTRLRSDIVVALKRASLERQLSGVTPNTLREIIEEALEPWLRSNGYLRE